MKPTEQQILDDLRWKSGEALADNAIFAFMGAT
jgi:hypothetical protein